MEEFKTLDPIVTETVTSALRDLHTQIDVLEQENDALKGRLEKQGIENAAHSETVVDALLTIAFNDREYVIDKNSHGRMHQVVSDFTEGLRSAYQTEVAILEQQVVEAKTGLNNALRTIGLMTIKSTQSAERVIARALSEDRFKTMAYAGTVGAVLLDHIRPLNDETLLKVSIRILESVFAAKVPDEFVQGCLEELKTTGFKLNPSFDVGPEARPLIDWEPPQHEPLKGVKKEQTITEQVTEFHRAFDFKVSQAPFNTFNEGDLRLRARLIAEEAFEFVEACGFAGGHLSHLKQQVLAAIANWGIQGPNLVEMADALADLDYVNEGARLTFGIPRVEVAAEVHRSNMSKVGGYKDEFGKWIKPDSWTPPDIKGVLMAAGLTPAVVG